MKFTHQLWRAIRRRFTGYVIVITREHVSNHVRSNHGRRAVLRGTSALELYLLLKVWTGKKSTTAFQTLLRSWPSNVCITGTPLEFSVHTYPHEIIVRILPHVIKNGILPHVIKDDIFAHMIKVDIFSVLYPQREHSPYEACGRTWRKGDSLREDQTICVEVVGITSSKRNSLSIGSPASGALRIDESREVRGLGIAAGAGGARKGTEHDSVTIQKFSIAYLPSSFSSACRHRVPFGTEMVEVEDERRTKIVMQRHSCSDIHAVKSGEEAHEDESCSSSQQTERLLADSLTFLEKSEQ